MMTTFHVIHIILGAWLAIVNYSGMLSSTALFWNNIILGIVIAAYNVYFLFLKENLDVANPK